MSYPAAKVHESGPDTFFAGHNRETQGYRTMRPRGSPSWLLIATMAGRAIVQHREEKLLLGAGDVIVYQPGVFQDYGMVEERGLWELRWAHFYPRPHWLEWLRWQEKAPGLLHLHLKKGRAFECVKAALARMNDMARRPFRLGEMLAMNALEEVLLWCDAANPLSARKPLDERIQKAVDDLCGELARPFSVASTARRCGLSASRFAHLFCEQLGVSPQRFVEEQRMTAAKRLLAHSSLPVAEIAVRAGFRDALYFSHRFKKATGQSPRAWRDERG